MSTPTPSSSSASTASGFGYTHYTIRTLARNCLTSFFREITVLGSENVPKDGPIIAACSHTNMAVDPAVLSSTIPHAHPVHYWVKDVLFANPIAGAIMRAAGNIPVDRKNKNNQSLFKGSFEAMERGESIAVFPEGTSHTSPQLLPFKDGISWLALEYLNYLNGQADGKPKMGARKAVILPVGLSYLDKSKYRSRIVVTYGEPIPMDEFEQEFLSKEEGSSRSAVKRLTKRLELEMMKLTVNASDWEAVVAAKMARELLFEKDHSLAPESYVQVSQTLVDIFSEPFSSPDAVKVKTILTEYNNLLITAKLTNQTLSDLPVPTNLDPSKPIPLPSRFSTLILLIRDTISVLLRVPFFLLPMIIHLPMYYVAKLGENIVREELETQAQMKIVFGLLFSLLVYPVVFVLVWVFLGFTGFGALIAAGAVYLFNTSHKKLVDENYDRMERLVAAWRVIVGIWTPKARERPMDYLKSFIPESATPVGATPADAVRAWQKGGPPVSVAIKAKLKEKKEKKRLPTRRLIKHVLRSRVKAAQALEAFLTELESSDTRVSAKPWLADSAAFGGEVDEDVKRTNEMDDNPDILARIPTGSRIGSEVVQYLRSNGAKITASQAGLDAWAGAQSEFEGVKSDEE